MIKVDSLCKTFRIFSRPVDRVKELVLRRQYHRDFHALDNVSFTVPDGSTLGIVGENGAGKSTLLKILTGVLQQDSGTTEIDGKITGLLELGTGFNHEFSGVRNIFLNGMLLGMSRKEIEAKLDSIIEFTELGEFINEPLKTYSSGMAMRLAFSIAIHADPKAFVVDEALSVGDAYFQQKCIKRIQEFKEQGGSIIFVSHDMNAVKILCDDAILLDGGKIFDSGDPEKIINLYTYLLAKKGAGKTVDLLDMNAEDVDYGDRKIYFTNHRILNEDGDEVTTLATGCACTFELTIQAAVDEDSLTVGMLIRDKFGQDIFGINNFHMKQAVSVKAGETKTLRYHYKNFNIGPGQYSLSVAAHVEDTHLDVCYHWKDLAMVFEVLSGGGFLFSGNCRLTPELEVI